MTAAAVYSGPQARANRRSRALLAARPALQFLSFVHPVNPVIPSSTTTHRGVLGPSCLNPTDLTRPTVFPRPQPILDQRGPHKQHYSTDNTATLTTTHTTTTPLPPPPLNFNLTRDQPSRVDSPNFRDFTFILPIGRDNDHFRRPIRVFLVSPALGRLAHQLLLPRARLQHRIPRPKRTSPSPRCTTNPPLFVMS